MKNPSEVGDLLARQLGSYANKPDVIVLALLRSGVPVAARVAAKLNAPLDIFLIRELHSPEQPGVIMGTIATGGGVVLQDRVINSLLIEQEVVAKITAREQSELARQEYCYRRGRAAADVGGKTVILVTDSITTGATAEAALAQLRQLRAKRIVIAAPTVARPEYNRLQTIADAVVAVIVPEEFFGARQWHHDFSQTSDEEVYQALAGTNRWVTEAAA